MTVETTDDEPGKPLTRREQQVCNYLCMGKTNKEIGRMLGLSRRTIEDHRFHVLKKMGVRNVIELLRKVYGLGPLPTGPAAEMQAG